MTALILTLILLLAVPAAAFGTGAPSGGDQTDKSGEICILYTSDVHCGIVRGFGYACLQQVSRYWMRSSGAPAPCLMRTAVFSRWRD